MWRRTSLECAICAAFKGCCPSNWLKSWIFVLRASDESHICIALLLPSSILRMTVEQLAGSTMLLLCGGKCSSSRLISFHNKTKSKTLPSAELTAGKGLQLWYHQGIDSTSTKGLISGMTARICFMFISVHESTRPSALQKAVKESTRAWISSQTASTGISSTCVSTHEILTYLKPNWTEKLTNIMIEQRPTISAVIVKESRDFTIHPTWSRRRWILLSNPPKDSRDPCPQKEDSCPPEDRMASSLSPVRLK